MICPHPIPRLFVCTLAVLLSAGCTFLRPSLPLPEGISDTASDLMQALDRRPHATTLKGIGHLTIDHPKTGRQHLRSAFVCAFPDKIRITLLAAGQPVETLVFDGKRMAAVSHTGAHRTYLKTDADPDLEKFLDIPIPVRYLIDLFCGRMPRIPADHAAVIDAPERILVLAAPDKGIIQRLWPDVENRVYKTTFSDINDDLVFIIQLDDFQRVGGIALPREVLLETRDKTRIHLRVDRYLPNEDLPDTAFALTGGS